jgi:hypothetical protein
MIAVVVLLHHQSSYLMLYESKIRTIVKGSELRRGQFPHCKRKKLWELSKIFDDRMKEAAFS